MEPPVGVWEYIVGGVDIIDMSRKRATVVSILVSRFLGVPIYHKISICTGKSTCFRRSRGDG